MISAAKTLSLTRPAAVSARAQAPRRRVGLAARASAEQPAAPAADEAAPAAPSNGASYSYAGVAYNEAEVRAASRPPPARAQ
jgi:hypothetical protein